MRTIHGTKRNPIKTTLVEGAGGVRLHVDETGPADGKPVLFLHGLSQSRMTWNAQMHSDLAEDFRLVAPDLRGHGASDKPRGVYGDPKVWADDVAAVIRTLGLVRPVLVGSSYAGVVMADYVRVHGEGAIAGTNWVGAFPGLGTTLGPFLGKAFLDLVPGLLSKSAEESAEAIQALIRAAPHVAPSVEEFFFRVGFNSVVPQHVREGLLSREVDNEAVVAKMQKPILLTYGLEDKLVLPTMGQHLAKLAPRAKLSTYTGVGHLPFWEAPDRFNQELREFRKGA